VSTRMLTGAALVLLLLAGGTVVVGPALADRVAAAALPGALEEWSARTGLAIVVGSVTTQHPWRVILHDVEATAEGPTRVTVRRIRIDLDAKQLLRGQVRPARVLAEEVTGQAVRGGLALALSGGLLRAHSAAWQPDSAPVEPVGPSGWFVEARGFARVGEEEPISFEARLDGQAADGGPTIIARFTNPLPLPLPGLPGGLTATAGLAEVVPGRGRVRFSQLALAGMPDDLEVSLAAIDVRQGDEGLREATRVTLHGLSVDGSADALARLLAREARGRVGEPATRCGGPAGCPAASARPRRPVLSAEQAEFRLSWLGRTVAAHQVDLSLEADGRLEAAARAPFLGPEARLELRLASAAAPADAGPGTRAAEFEVTLIDGELIEPAISPNLLDDLRGTVKGKASWDPKPGRLKVAIEDGRMRGAEFALDATVERLGLEGRRPTVRLALRLPEQPCAALAAAVPEGMWNALAGMQVEGRIAASLDFGVDMEAIEESISLEGEGDPARCRALTLGPTIDVERLLADDYSHEWTHSRTKAPLRVGPATPGYVRLSRVPAHTRRSMTITEDSRFFRHNGVSVSLIKKALRINLTKGGFTYGGSTITQQLVKNLFLQRRKDLSRKLEEAVIALQLERVVPKERILELYLNVIEFGPNIYGIRRASRYYFAKSPSSLAPIEGAFLAAIKPQPSSGPGLARRGTFGGWWHLRLIEIMGWLQEGGLITEVERAEAFPFYPSFTGSAFQRRGPQTG